MAAVIVGLGTPADGADALWREQVKPRGVLSLVRHHAGAAAGALRVETARWRGGDRSALHAKARGGHRPVAARLNRPPAVCDWLRAAACRSEPCARRWAHALDPEVARSMLAGSLLGDAVEALASAARARVLWFGAHTGTNNLTFLEFTDRNL